MSGRRGVCLLCRHTFLSRLQINIARRFASARTAEPYVLSRLVIDLDAADSKLVRKAEEAVVEDFEPSSQNIQPQLHRTISLDKSKHKLRQRHNTKVALRIFNVIPTDLMSYTLFGSPNPSTATEDQFLWKIIKTRGIQLGDSVDHVVEQLSLDFTTNATENLRRAGFLEQNGQAILKQIKRSDLSFSDLHRIISTLSSTSDGCQFLASNGSHVLDAIRRCRKSQGMGRKEGVTVTMVLRLLNNLHRNMESKGIQIGQQLCNAGLYYASKGHSIPAVKMYLQTSRENSYASDWRAGQALRFLFLAVKHQNLDSKQVLPLITGWRDGSRPRGGEKRSQCFAFLSYNDKSENFLHALYPRYILGLGELGLSDALYAEWMLEDEHRMAPLLRGEGHKRFRAQMFAIAFLLAKDSKRALSTLEAIPTDHQDEQGGELLSTSRNWKPNWKPTIEENTPPIGSSGQMWTTAMFLDHYNFHYCKPTERFWARLLDSLQNLPADPQQALKVLDGLLVAGLEKSKSPRTKIKVRPSVDWGEIDGEEGIIIMPYEGNIPLYWKPAARLAEQNAL